MTRDDEELPAELAESPPLVPAGNLPSGRKLAVKLAAMAPKKVEQPHGGALYAGGVPGHRGGTGRLPSRLRQAMRQALAERLHIAEAIADDETGSASDRLRALDFMAKYGLGTTITETDTEGKDKARVIEVPPTESHEQWAMRARALNGNGNGRRS